MKEENCPICPNHCAKDHLGCGRGREYFNRVEKDSKPKTLQEEVVMDLRKCGHLLHHSKDLDTNQLLSIFSEEELMQLHYLLSKINQ